MPGCPCSPSIVLWLCEGANRNEFGLDATEKQIYLANALPLLVIRSRHSDPKLFLELVTCTFSMENHDFRTNSLGQGLKNATSDHGTQPMLPLPQVRGHSRRIADDIRFQNFSYPRSSEARRESVNVGSRARGLRIQLIVESSAGFAIAIKQSIHVPRV
ncbi:hypothetical protein SAMN04515620_11355 [Collimonas sp. OK607]|nr:hypothetical protein SAMN04515620_11355 [Collimonas sp. OK607]